MQTSRSLARGWQHLAPTLKNMDNYPPPANVCTDGLSEYYLGCLLYYDDESEDNCRWVIYDGHSRIRCVTRDAAVEFIARNYREDSTRAYTLLVAARMHLHAAHKDLVKAAAEATGPKKLCIEQTSARLRPYIVLLDNLIL